MLKHRQRQTAAVQHGGMEAFDVEARRRLALVAQARVDAAKVGIPGAKTARDLWTGDQTSLVAGVVETTIPAHGTYLALLS